MEDELGLQATDLLDSDSSSPCSRLSSYKRKEEKEEVKGHNHPADEKCGQYCPRNEHYKGRKKRYDILHRNK